MDGWNVRRWGGRMKYEDLMNLKDIDLIGTLEPHVNSLRLMFIRRRVSDKPESIIVGDKLYTGYPVIADEQLPIIQVDFETYISYCITNESLTVWDDFEEFEGQAFRIYRKSRFLDFIKTHTFALDSFPGPFTHYGMVCIDHIINIVSVSPPIIAEIK